MTKKIAAIWAQDQNELIGKNQSLPWHLPAELKHFKEITSGHAILMGRGHERWRRQRYPFLFAGIVS